jgi:hypothetical protein
MSPNPDTWEDYLREIREHARREAYASVELDNLMKEARDEGGLSFEEAYRAALEGKREAVGDEVS